MGAYWSSIRRTFGFTREIRVLLVGLDNAGKTTLLYRLQLGDVLTTVPTVGFNVEPITHSDVRLQAWDIGGQTSIRQFWKCYYRHTDVVLFVVDGTDTERMDVCRRELMELICNPQLRNTLIAILVNKQDAAGVMPIEEVQRVLQLELIRLQQWKVFSTSAVTGRGLDDVMRWVVEKMGERGVV